jgi:hypothetical protein
MWELSGIINMEEYRRKVPATHLSELTEYKYEKPQAGVLTITL